jgi:esterase/lipase
MRKLVVILFISVVFAIFLVVLAFFYVDLSGHKGFRYDLLKEGRFFGSIRVDRYITEDKVIYKGTAEYPYSLEYPVVNEKLSLKKKTMTPLKFVEEADGGKGQKRLTLLAQEGEKTDFLFLEHPKFITLKGFETGEKTMVFFPTDLMLYMPIMEKYNFWKKGTQSFEVMIPVSEPIPPIRDKVEVTYLKDEYIPVMGRRMEAESFAIGAKTLPTAKIFLSKYTHRILALEIDKMNLRFVLVSFIESPKRIKPAVDKFISIFNLRKAGGESPPAEAPLSGRGGLPEEATPPADTKGSEQVTTKEIFFKSGSLILSGKLWVPEGKGPFPAALIIPKDGPFTKGQQYLFNSLGKFLSASGFIIMVFDSPGQGKSQGSFVELSDEKRIQNIIAAVSYLEGHPAVEKKAINLIGYEGGGYLALKAASSLPFVRTGIILGVPEGFTKSDFFQGPSKENIQVLLNACGIGPADEKYMETITKKTQDCFMEVARSSENFSFFMGVRTPLKEYREFMARRPYETILSSDKPLLLIFGKDDKRFNLQAVEGLKESLEKKDHRDKVAVFRNLDTYMGRMEMYDDSWGFTVNKDVLDLIGNWIRKNGIYIEEEPPSVEAGEPAESASGGA